MTVDERIAELEARVKKLEAILAPPAFVTLDASQVKPLIYDTTVFTPEVTVTVPTKD